MNQSIKVNILEIQGAALREGEHGRDAEEATVHVGSHKVTIHHLDGATSEEALETGPEQAFYHRNPGRTGKPTLVHWDTRFGVRHYLRIKRAGGRDTHLLIALDDGFLIQDCEQQQPRTP